MEWFVCRLLIFIYNHQSTLSSDSLPIAQRSELRWRGYTAFVLITTFLTREFRMTHLITGSLYSQEQYSRKVINHPAGSWNLPKILWAYHDWFRSYKQDLFGTVNGRKRVLNKITYPRSPIQVRNIKIRLGTLGSPILHPLLPSSPFTSLDSAHPLFF